MKTAFFTRDPLPTDPPIRTGEKWAVTATRNGDRPGVMLGRARFLEVGDTVDGWEVTEVLKSYRSPRKAMRAFTDMICVAQDNGTMDQGPQH